MKLFLILSLLASSAFSTCQFSSLKINWTAFKTANKVGVKGSFKNVELIQPKTIHSSVPKILSNLAAKIDTQKVHTKNSERDAKIYKHFFKRMNGGDKIKAWITDADKDTFNLNIKMNKSTKQVPMKYSLRKGILTATGVMDIFDFNLSKSLKSLNNACLELHKGKTWNDVDLKVTAKYSCSK
jgi:hypothetical protein